jgi:hypothetical protein
MTHEELLAKMKELSRTFAYEPNLNFESALRAVVELHKPLPIVNGNGAANCCWCQIAGIRETPYPCPTIQAIEKELN